MIIDKWDYRINDLIHCMTTFAEETKYPIAVSDKIKDDIWLVFNDPDSQFIVGYSGVEPTGFAFVQVDKLFMSEPFGYMNKFYILPKFRGTGEGRKLVAECIDWFTKRGVTYSFTSTTGNIGEDQAYKNMMQKFGFTDAGIVLHRKTPHV